MTSDKTITSLQNPVIKKLRSLSAKKYRDEDGIFMVEGARHVMDALAAKWQPDTLAYAPRALHDAAAVKAIEEARAVKAQVMEVTDDILSSITNRDNAQPLLATFKQRTLTLEAAGSGFWVGLENIRDPGNLGTILRTADAVGAKGVLLLGTCCDPWSFEVVRASMGSFARVPLVEAQAAEFLDWKKTYKGRVIGTHLHDKAVDYRDTAYVEPLVLLMGSESEGLSAGMSAACDTLVKIPMTSSTESLNLAVSTGIMLYEIAGRKLPK